MPRSRAASIGPSSRLACAVSTEISPHTDVAILATTVTGFDDPGEGRYRQRRLDGVSPRPADASRWGIV
ncbi:hypothetical protein VB735_02915 [Halotia wernerae UHCC 0503]|nr:hypothetical protein [Halotia wernerae UHCC 0503]